MLLVPPITVVPLRVTFAPNVLSVFPTNLELTKTIDPPLVFASAGVDRPAVPLPATLLAIVVLVALTLATPFVDSTAMIDPPEPLIAFPAVLEEILASVAVRDALPAAELTTMTEPPETPSPARLSTTCKFPPVA